MPIKILLGGALIAGSLNAGATLVQSSQSSQATSPGQSGASNTLPQAPSGGKPAAGGSASGPETTQEQQADTQAKKATGQVCQGC